MDTAILDRISNQVYHLCKEQKCDDADALPLIRELVRKEVPDYQPEFATQVQMKIKRRLYNLSDL